MKNNKKAFTLVEVLMVALVIAVVMILTLFTDVHQQAFNEKKIKDTSSGFFSNVQNCYTELLLYNSSNNSITGLKDIDGNVGLSSEDIAEHFITPLDGKDTDCSNVKTPSDISSYKTNAVCLKFPSKVNAAFKYYPNCDQTIKTREYYIKKSNPSEPDYREVANVCASIVYSTQNSTGVLGKDVFVISLGKRAVK